MLPRFIKHLRAVTAKSQLGRRTPHARLDKMHVRSRAKTPAKRLVGTVRITVCRNRFRSRTLRDGTADIGDRHILPCTRFPDRAR